MSGALPRNGWPKDFTWGVSTSAYQIEGAAHEDGRGLSIWDVRAITKDKVYKNESGETACDHYHRYPEDIALMKGLGVDAYRFSLAWPRILPTGRTFVNEKGLDFYDRLIDSLLEAGIEPWACLYHWDLPQGLHSLGGWAQRECAGWFADYATLCARRYGDRVKKWITFNEFSVFTLFGYAIDWAAPGITDRATHLRAIHHVNLAHGMGVDVLRTHVKDAVIGAVHNRQAVWPEKDTEADRRAAALLNEHWNLAFPDPQILGHYPPLIARDMEPYIQGGDMAQICRPVDFFGLNHYGPIFAKEDLNSTWGFGWGDSPPGSPDHGIGWPVWPDAFRDELLELRRRYKLPVVVTENGCAGDDAVNADGKVEDPRRIKYLELYTAKMAEAMDAGVDVRGYFVWSLLDAFEWGSGYGPRFGLVHVDHSTQTRTPKSSYDWYQALIQSAKPA